MKTIQIHKAILIPIRSRKTLLLSLSFICLLNSSCIKKLNLYEEDPNRKQEIIPEPDFIYPFSQETQSKTLEITIHTKDGKSVSNISTAEIPPLKYNKEFLLMMTQDDCKQSAFCYTWAAINGKPLSYKYSYDLTHLQVSDLPPDYYYLGKTLGSTDGTGREVRFSFTTTLAPEWKFMNEATTIFKSNTKDNGRFTMKTGLLWGNVKEMLNYGVSIAFHDMLVNDADKTPTSLVEHFGIAQSTIQNKLQGRGCKMLAEPNNDKMYIEAAKNYPFITTSTAQSGAEKLYPFQETTDLRKTILERGFFDSPSKLQNEIQKEYEEEFRNRRAIHQGVHNTDTGWIDFLVWLNDTYGKNGDDTMWMTSQEEYYEYNYYRNYCQPVVIPIDAQTLKIGTTLTNDGSELFYYPSITINVDGIRMEDIAEIESNNEITGLSYANRKDGNGIMLNIDCRKYLTKHAENFVLRYEKDPANTSNKADAKYFVNMLKNSETKTSLLNRIK